MENQPISKPFLLSLAIFLGLFFLGLFIFRGLKTFSDKDRVVTVKGLAEMNMTATSASIVLEFSTSGDDLQNLLNQSSVKKNAIVSYLITNGFNKSDLTIENIGVTDKQKYYELQWNGNQQIEVKIDRYIISQRIIIKSKDIKNTEAKAAKINLDLVSKNLTSVINTNYDFPELNSIKPKLIAESTKNARVAGEQFANDSQAELGKIKTASQGQISIAGKNIYYNEDEQNSEKPKEPYLQKARVVSTIVFFLE